jgi:predicted HTH domain antitoxin
MSTTEVIPLGFEQSVKTTRAEAISQIRLMAALKMFELGKLSSGKAAELAGMSRVEFFETCSRYRVSVINIPPEEVEKELRQEVENGIRIFSQKK